jgi:hypothetical protein
MAWFSLGVLVQSQPNIGKTKPPHFEQVDASNCLDIDRESAW